MRSANIRNASIDVATVSLTTAVRRYMAVLLALLRREEESRRHTPMESIMNLLEPIALVATMTSAAYFLEKGRMPPVGTSMVLFYTTGFFAKYFFIYVSRRIGAPLKRRFPMEQRLDIVIVHIVIRVADYALLGVVGFGALYIFATNDAIPHDFVPVFQACVALVMIGFGWSIFNLVVTRKFWVWGYIFPVFNRALIILSGVFFIPDFLSPTTRYMLSFNPILHAIALFRTGFYPQYPTLLLDTWYLTLWAVGAVLFGLMLERVTRRAEGG